MISVYPMCKCCSNTSGARDVTSIGKVPFARASREEDYRVAWAFFEQRKGDS